MALVKLEASLRKRPGKGPARRLREKGMIPAVLYGQGVETTALSMDPRSLVKALAGPMRINTLLEVAIEGKKEPRTVMVKDHQYDPVTRQLLHVDLYAVQMDNPIKVDVPLKVEGRSQGEQLGGTLNKLYRKLPVECTPANIPEAIVVDVTPLNVNDMLTVKDITMPENVTLLLSEKSPILTIEAKRVEVEETAEEGEEEGGEATDKEKEGAAAPADSSDKETSS